MDEAALSDSELWPIRYAAKNARPCLVLPDQATRILARLEMLERRLGEMEYWEDRARSLFAVENAQLQPADDGCDCC